MVKNREESFIGDTTLKIYERIKSWGKIAHSVGGVIPSNQENEWHKLRNRFERYGVQLNKGGLMFAIKWTNTLMDATCPIAEDIGYHPIGLTNDLVIMCAELIKGINKDKWVDESGKLRKEIVQQVGNQISASIEDEKKQK